MNVQSDTRRNMDKRQQILEATADLIAEQGLHSCPMAMVAKHACCGAGTIYRYFETKEELVQQLFLHLTEVMASHCMSGYDESAGVKLRFYSFWGNFYRYMLEKPRDRALMEQLSASPAISELQREEALKPMNKALTMLLTDGKQQQLIKNLPDAVLTTMTFGSLTMMAKKLQLSPQMFPQAVQPDDLLNLCWDAIKA